MRKEQMSSIERINALLEGQHIDRVPVYLWVMSSPFAARNVGYSVESSYKDPEKSFWAQMWTKEMYGSDDLPLEPGTQRGLLVDRLNGQLENMTKLQHTSVFLLSQRMMP